MSWKLYQISGKTNAMKNKLSILTLSVFILAFAGCTSNEESGNVQADSNYAAGQSSVVDDVSQRNILQIAMGSEDHTTLVAGVKAGELVESLANAGPFTVFAPTNAAFAALPEGALDDLLKPENKSALRNVLQYHVALSTFTLENMEDGQVLGMANSGSITISKTEDGKVSVNGANVVASIPASNGIVHVVDAVMLPPQ
jgi:uncharacterized surface protein with fasciclin (FAS1) repeats